jgi:hypothetical protein
MICIIWISHCKGLLYGSSRYVIILVFLGRQNAQLVYLTENFRFWILDLRLFLVQAPSFKTELIYNLQSFNPQAPYKECGVNLQSSIYNLQLLDFESADCQKIRIGTPTNSSTITARN